MFERRRRALKRSGGADDLESGKGLFEAGNSFVGDQVAGKIQRFQPGQGFQVLETRIADPRVLEGKDTELLQVRKMRKAAVIHGCAHEVKLNQVCEARYVWEPTGCQR